MSEVTEGYMDGLSDDRSDLPASLANRSDEYRHGWQNGRDDRLKRPRASAARIRADIAQIRANNTSSKGADG